MKSSVQKTAAICFIPPVYVCVVWQGKQHELPDIVRTNGILTALGSMVNTESVRRTAMTIMGQGTTIIRLHR